MENASKALTMAAGILIGLIIISLIVILFTRISNLKKVDMTEEEARQLAEFNQKYTKYLNKYIYGTEVVTVINKGKEDGVEVYIGDEKKDQYIINVTAYSEKKYQCTNVSYDAKGRVNIINFKEVAT